MAKGVRLIHWQLIKLAAPACNYVQVSYAEYLIPRLQFRTEYTKMLLKFILGLVSTSIGTLALQHDFIEYGQGSQTIYHSWKNPTVDVMPASRESNHNPTSRYSSVLSTPTSLTAATPQLLCPSYNGTPWTPFINEQTPYRDKDSSLTFVILCDTNLPALQSFNPDLKDLSHMRTSSLEECIRGCAENFSPGIGNSCTGVTWDVDNICFFKTGVDITKPLGSGPGGKASAVLLPYKITWLGTLQ